MLTQAPRPPDPPDADLHEYRQALREHICTQCLDGDEKGNCNLDPSFDCTLHSGLPIIVDVIRHVDGNQMDDYWRELRNILCARCLYQTVNGCCGIRGEDACALDRYFPLVVNIIERIEGKSEALH